MVDRNVKLWPRPSDRLRQLTVLPILFPSKQYLLQKILHPTSSLNTPIWAVKKSNGTYRLVQDLWLINSSVVLLYPAVPNSYTLFSTIPSGFWISRMPFSLLLSDLNLKASLPPPGLTLAFTAPHSSPGLLSQRFQDSPHLFGQALATDVLSLSLPKSKLIQYVDDILLCSPSLEISQTDTYALLNFSQKRL